MNETTDTDETNEIRHIKERKRRTRPDETNNTKFKRKKGVNCNKCGNHNWTHAHIPDCPAKNKKCNNCKKIGHLAIVCRSKQRIQHISERTDSSNAEDQWTPDRIHLIQRTIHSTHGMDKKSENYYTETVLVNGRPIKFIVDTGSPVTLIPMAKFNNTTKIKPMTKNTKTSTTII